ncbi:HTTM domain-containing protein [bacterium]|jgi:vitamin K-dependent gamma-carboxylase|nr:HTTM domain-containing protein [bacterium]
MIKLNDYVTTIKSKLNTDINGLSLAIFRIGFGLILGIQEGLGSLLYDKFYTGYISTLFHAPYPSLSAITLPSSIYTAYILYFILILSCLFIALGYHFKISSLVFFVTYTYFFLLDYNFYNNHYYLICLFGLFLFLSNAHHKFSIDSRKKNIESPKHWHLFLFQFQVCIMYFYAGLAKLTSINWLNAEPLKLWVKNFPKDHLFNTLFSNEFSAYMFSYAGLLVDLSLPFLILFKKTRHIGILLMIGFHSINYFVLFSPLNNNVIGSFSVLGVLIAILFFDDSTIEKYISKILNSFLFNKSKNIEVEKQSIVIPICFSLFFIIQFSIPFRYLLIDGNSNPRWTEIGRTFSWMDFTTYKRSTLDIEIGKLNVPPKKVNISNDLTKFQHHIGGIPYSTLQLLKVKTKQAESSGIDNPLGYAKANVSLNGRNHRPITNSFLNLDRTNWTPFSNQIWIRQYSDL